MPGLQIENYCVWFEIGCARGEKNATLQRKKKIYKYEMDKINAQNYVNVSKKKLKKCLKMCGKAIHLPRLNDRTVRNQEKKLCIFRIKIVVFGQFYAKYFHEKQFHNAQIVLHYDWQQLHTGKLYNTRCFRATVIT